MPYIPQEERNRYDQWLEIIGQEFCNSKTTIGHLTYCIYVLMVMWIDEKGKSYTTISQACAAATDAAYEFRRQKLNPYEDEKIKENGEI